MFHLMMTLVKPPGHSPGVTWLFDFKQNLFLNSKFSFQKQRAIRNTKIWLKNGKMSRYTLANPLPPLFVIWWHCPDPPRVSRIIWMDPKSKLSSLNIIVVSFRILSSLIYGCEVRLAKAKKENNEGNGSFKVLKNSKPLFFLL